MNRRSLGFSLVGRRAVLPWLPNAPGVQTTPPLGQSATTSHGGLQTLPFPSTVPVACVALYSPAPQVAGVDRLARPRSRLAQVAGVERLTQGSPRPRVLSLTRRN